ncbi:class I SAM-dependent methyltransferase [Candidatus Venteria ishoeyi]|uniref:class I SAM-dependent methyltransferase n=1 Tax=Candidatus Venteria ishoeyi TaxID=1899563 RepID=UPI0025A68E6C|nr:class I SAM-dependent methyltransferase [Candidatus Venteria ishoeyi]MDM8545774.1 class I SAM-dependent methyltransferase [Candidatus Venteria ishoeyi]
MDKLTIANYDKNAKQIAKLHCNLTPVKLYQLIRYFFSPHESVIDIGCGIGRDCYWLQQQGFVVTGIDASQGMLQQAHQRYPTINFIHDTLPNLIKLRDVEYVNVLCSAVVMHLNPENLSIAIKNLLRITHNNGVILLSFRGTSAINYREDGKLYAPITQEQIINLFLKQDALLLYQSQDREQGRGHLWHNLVFRK